MFSTIAALEEILIKCDGCRKLDKKKKSEFTGLPEYDCKCEESSRKSVVAPEEAAWKLIDYLD